MSRQGYKVEDTDHKSSTFASLSSSPPGTARVSSASAIEEGYPVMAGRAENTVLAVNDAPDSLEVMSRLLRKSGYRVVTASDGREGFEVAQAVLPDLIVSDVSMPRMDGIEMCRRVREHPELRSTPVILISAVCKDSESMVEGLKAGADDCLETPYDSLLLVTKVVQLIERRRAEQELSRSEERYRDMVENAHDIIYSHDLEGNYTSINKAGERITGYTREEALRLNLEQTVAPEYVEKVRRMLARKLAGEEVTAYDLEIVAKDGRRIAVEVNTRLVYQGGVAVGVQGIARDVTERRQLEEQLRQAQKMEAVGRLAGGIAHDFNNLLTAITGYSDLTLRRLRPEDPLRRNVEEIKRAGDRAASLTRQLLAFSRKQVLQPKVLDLNSVVSDMEKMLRRLIGEDIELRTALAPELGSVRADPGQIEQVIMNLAVNARDAMPHGGNLIIETGNVSLDEGYATRHIAVKPGAYVMLAVSDTGEGMSEETQSRVFEPFFTTKEVGRGTGLGLSTVYGIVKQSGGNIWVYSEAGEGTAFKIYLPRVDEAAQEYKPHHEVEENLDGTETILLAEDDGRVRSLVRAVLEAHGYRVLEAKDGGAAVAISERHGGPIHLLLTDVVMPKMSGRELADRLARVRPEMKVLYMSGYTDDAIVHHGVLDAGMKFIQKPFAAGALAQKVREVLGDD
jgi:two-component system cell cycle sensor histidine kinase/response regulator CckA